MKKAIPLLLLAAGAAMGLCGCGLALGLLYPGQAGGANTVTFDVSGSSANQEVSTNAGDAKVWVMLYENGKYQKAASVYMHKDSSGNYTADLEFVDLDDGSYSGYAWLDGDGNRKWEAPEPQGTSASASVSGDGEASLPIVLN